MSTIALPAGFCPRDFSLRMQVNQTAFFSPFGGSEQVVDRLNDRWMMSVTMPARRSGEGAAIEAFIGSMRGLSNTVALYHFQRPIPRGSMRGTPTVVSGVPQGNSFFHIQTTAFATLLAGDMIGVAGLLLQISTDSTADGSGVLRVDFVNRTRTTITAGTSVTWDRPTAPFRMMSATSQQYVPGYAPEVSFEFAEAIG